MKSYYYQNDDEDRLPPVQTKPAKEPISAVDASWMSSMGVCVSFGFVESLDGFVQQALHLAGI